MGTLKMSGGSCEANIGIRWNSLGVGLTGYRMDD